MSQTGTLESIGGENHENARHRLLPSRHPLRPPPVPLIQLKPNILPIMNSQSPEHRLLAELLREQAHGPDEAFLKQIEAAVDAGPKIPAARHSYARFAIAAGLALAAGAGIWWRPFDRRLTQRAVAKTEEMRLAPEVSVRTEIVPGGMKDDSLAKNPGEGTKRDFAEGAAASLADGETPPQTP